MRNRIGSIFGIGLLLVGLLVLWSPALAQAGDGFLGINLDPEAEAAVVVNVLPDSAAEEAGLMAGDIITAVDGESVDAETLASVIGSYSAGDTVTLTVSRNDDTLELEATLGTRPEVAEPPAPFGEVIIPDQPRLGVGLEGTTITSLTPGSPADDAGLQVGDTITAIDGQSVNNIRQVRRALAAIRAGETTEITVERDGETLTVEAELSPMLQGGTRMLQGDEIVYLPEEQAWEVQNLSPVSILADSGIEEGDRIVAVDGEPFTPDTEFTFNQNETVTLTVERDGETMEIEVSSIVLLLFQGFNMGRFDFEGLENFEVLPPDGQLFGGMMANQARLGVEFVTIDAEIAAENELNVDDGALVTEVAADSPAEAAGIQENDIITAVDDDIIDFERTLSDRIFAYEPGDVVTLTLLRDGEELQIDVTLDEARMMRGFMMPEDMPRFEIPVPPEDMEPAMPEGESSL